MMDNNQNSTATGTKVPEATKAPEATSEPPAAPPSTAAEDIRSKIGLPAGYLAEGYCKIAGQDPLHRP